MPTPLPNLDNRRWSDLVEEGRTLIPRYAPEWTDHNAHDPGITLVELYAWLAEMAQYRLNRVPSRHKRKFTSLLGFEPAGPQPARVTLTFDPAPATPAFRLAAGVEFEGTAPDGRVAAFRTLREVTVSPAVLREVRVDAGGGTAADRTQAFFDGLPLELLGPDPRPGAAFYLGFDPVGASVPVALGFRFAGPGNDAAERDRIVEEAAAQAAACRPVEPRFRCVPEEPVPAPGMPPHHSARIVWEVFTARGWVGLENVEPPATAGVEQVSDDTRAFTLDGIVEVNLPADIQPTALGGAALFYVRARLAAGALDAVPVLLDLGVNATPCEQAVPVTQAFPIRAGVAASGAPPAPGAPAPLNLTLDAHGMVQALDFGAGTGPALAVYSYTAAGAGTPGSITPGIALAGFGSGRPEQEVTLRDAPVEAASVRVYTLSGAGWQEWERRNDFDASGREDYHYVLDATTGEVRFGDGERGRAPQAGDPILAAYRTTGAENGNLPAGLVRRVRESAVNTALLAGLSPAQRAELSGITTNRSGAAGGAAAETLAHTIGRAVAALHAHERVSDLAAGMRSATLDQIERARVRALPAPRRAVNLVDLERIALSVPGARIARARAWASLHPSYSCLQAPGVVTLVVVPEAPPSRPAPSPGLLEAVWRYLNRRRLVTTVIQVVGPEYVEVKVTAKVRARTGASAAKVAARVQEALTEFLDPLAGGPDGLGWPFGRSVFRSEILQLIDGVPGADHVVSMSLATAAGVAQCGDLALCPTALVCSGAHEVEIV